MIQPNQNTSPMYCHVRKKADRMKIEKGNMTRGKWFKYEAFIRSNANMYAYTRTYARIRTYTCDRFYRYEFVSITTSAFLTREDKLKD